jgi:hypothetical protein
MPTPRDKAPTTIYAVPDVNYFYVTRSVVISEGPPKVIEVYSYPLPAVTLLPTFSVGSIQPNVHRSAHQLAQVDVSDAGAKANTITASGKIYAFSQPDALIQKQVLGSWIRDASWLCAGDGGGGIELYAGRNGCDFSMSTQEKNMSVISFTATFVPKNAKDFDTNISGWF